MTKRGKQKQEEKQEFKYTIRLSREEAQRLFQLAAKKMMTKSEFIRYLIRNAAEEGK